MATNEMLGDRLNSFAFTSSTCDRKSEHIAEAAHQAIPLLVGDYRVQLLPKYRRRRCKVSKSHRKQRGTTPEMTSSMTTQRRRLRDATNKMLMPIKNLIPLAGKCDDDDDDDDDDVINEDSTSTSAFGSWQNSNASVVVGNTGKPSCNESDAERVWNKNGVHNDDHLFTNNGHHDRLSPLTRRHRNTRAQSRLIGVGSIVSDLVNGEFQETSTPTSPDQSLVLSKSADSAIDAARLSSISQFALFRNHDPPSNAGNAALLPTMRCVEPDVDDDEEVEWQRRRDEPLLDGVDQATSKPHPKTTHNRFRRMLIGREMTSSGKRGGGRIEHARAISSAVRERCDPYEWSRKVLGFLASTVGLTCLLVGYTALGGCLFVRLEGQNDRRVESDMRATRREYVERLWAMTERLNVLHRENWTQLAERILDAYSVHVFEATKRHGWDGRNDEDDHRGGEDDDGGRSEQWSYAGALLFSITVITTIGYGHITPKTPLGRLATIIYAVVGIPLTLLTITQLGSIMATLFRFIYKNIDALCWQTICQRLRSRPLCATSKTGCCCTFRSTLRYLNNRKSSKCKRDVILDDAVSALERTGSGCARRNSVSDQIEDQPENEIMLRTLETATSESERFYFSNLDDVIATKNESCHKMVSSVAEPDNDDDVMIIVHDDERVGDACETMHDGSTDDVTRQRVRWTTRLRSRVLVAFADVDDVRVPAWVCLLLVVGYITLGALVFSVWERTGDNDGNDSDDWDFLVGCYFCFVTLSTIGFGDYVPGTRHVTADDGQEKLVLCAFYLLIGLALQAMCFQLIQEDVRRAVRSLGVRLGLVRRDETN